jgi:FMN phosphatase YigB (HAD superfamily)
MSKIKNIVFDFGGVIIQINYEQAVRRFSELGLQNVENHLDPYTQRGIFGDMECGKISDETFRAELSKLVGRELTWDECQWAWLGFFVSLPPQNIEALRRLKAEGYHLVLLSNTNPYMMSWARSDEFDGEGHGVGHYFDALYLSYEQHLMKPDAALFRRMLENEHIKAEETLFVDDGPKNTAAAAKLGFHTLCPADAGAWAAEIESHLG